MCGSESNIWFSISVKRPDWFSQWLDSLSYLLQIVKVPWRLIQIFDIFCFALLDNTKQRYWTWQKWPATTAHCSCTVSILKGLSWKTVWESSKIQWQLPTNICGIEELNFCSIFISLLTLCCCSRWCVSPSKEKITQSIRILIWMLFAMAMAKPFKASEYQLRVRVMSYDIWVFQFVHWQNVKRP